MFEKRVTTMKRPMVAVSGLLWFICLSLMSTAAQRTAFHDRVATDHGSERAGALGSEGGASTVGPQTPAELLAQNKKLSDKLSTILEQQNPPITDLRVASQGFGNLGVFVTAVHVSQNLGIPFDQLKTQKQASGTLAKATHMLKPDADINAEIWKASEQAVGDIRESRLE